MCNGVAMSVAADWLAVMMPGVFCISDSTYLHVARRVLMSHWESNRISQVVQLVGNAVRNSIEIEILALYF